MFCYTYKSMSSTKVATTDPHVSQVIVVDWNNQSVKSHCRNAVLLPRWKGNDDDHTLVDLAVFLRSKFLHENVVINLMVQ